METRSRLHLRARIVVPMSGPVIEDGIATIQGNAFACVDAFRNRRKTISGPIVDLGAVILMPGLVNSHCHLDYTHMAGLIPPMKSFSDWIKVILSMKADWSYSEFAHSWTDGARMLVESGATTVADVEAVPELLPDVWKTTPLRVFSFLEMTNVKNKLGGKEIVNNTLKLSAHLKPERGAVGLSPHAPYSTTGALLRATASASEKSGIRVTTHVSESREEYEMFLRAQGPMHDWLKGQRDMSDCGNGSPVLHLERHGLLNDRLLAAHANYLGDIDAKRLGSSGVSVVHCPRCHEYFNHARFPLAELSAQGANLCLGTDSLASIKKTGAAKPRLNLFKEMQALARDAPFLDPEFILNMATTHGARALGMAGRLGVLQPDALADCIAIPYEGAAVRTSEFLVHEPDRVCASMIDGEWAIPPN